MKKWIRLNQIWHENDDSNDRITTHFTFIKYFVISKFFNTEVHVGFSNT